MSNLSFYPYEDIVRIIEEDGGTEEIHKAGWHGLIPLHRAALRGDTMITRLLLSNKASVNHPNDYGETPLHYACKRGTIQNIHLMLEMEGVKGDVWQRDQAGRNCLHHAASGGSVLSMHYLAEVHGMAFHDRDYAGKTPLHIVSLQGFQDALKYLLKKERCDVTSTDNDGNTALHIACMNAVNETCWILLQNSNCNQLHSTNNCGQTPLQILQEGKTARHPPLLKELSYWSHSKTPNLPPRGPLLTWYLLLALPTIIYAIIILISLTIASYGTLFGSIATLTLAWFLSSSDHRLMHLSRWSNPIFFGAFAAGMMHTLVCFGFKLLPVLWPQTMYYHSMVDLSLLGIISYLYAVLLVRDPGRCQTSRAGPSINVPLLSIEHVAKGDVSYEEFCCSCEIVIPDRVRHCKLCEQCMYGFDHHCLFLLRCIARNNHRHFIMFIIAIIASQVLFITYSYQYLCLEYPTWHDLGMGVLNDQGWIWTMCVLNLLSLLWELQLTVYQLRLVSNGVTMLWRPTYNHMSKVKPGKLSRAARLRNLVYFFSGRRTLTVFDLGQTESV